MVVPFAAGSAYDVLGRILATRLSELLGRLVIVDNVSGGGGTTGTLRFAKAAPDGYQFILGTTNTHAINQTFYKDPPYNAATDFTPVALVTEQPIVLIARKELPVGNLSEFIAYAKANQTRMQYGSPGVCTGSHLACALFDAATGINATHIAYRGNSQAIEDLVGGQIDYQCPTALSALPLIESDAVKAVAVLTKNRSPILPTVASAHEQGLIDFDTPDWTGIFLPKGTPPLIVQKLHGATVATMNTPAVQERLKELGATIVAPERRSPVYLQNFVAHEIEKWAAPIRASGVSVD